MIDIDNWMRELEEEEDIEIKNNEEYQTKLFEEYVLRGSDHQEERRKLNERYLSGEELMGEHGLRKELAAFDMSYFGRAYLPHYFIRKSPHFHEELDEIWSRGVMKGRNPLKEAKVISRLKGSRQVVAAPRGHAKSTNFTFKDSLHAILYAYKHYILILSDSSEQAEGFLDDIKTELEDNANIIMDFGSLKGDKAWRTGVILTKTDIKAEAIGSGKKVRGRRHRNWRPDLIVLDDIENDENVNTPEQRRKLKNWFDKAVSKAGDTYTDIMYIGTILHYDSLLNNVLQNPRYKTKKYRAELKELARTIVNGCFIKHAEGDWLKIKAADYSKQQKEAKAARGYVSIYRSEYNNALQVTKGHCFKTEPDAGGNELKFYCCENTVIDAGEPVGRVLVEAEATGTYYNIAPGRITISMIHLDGVDYVTNEDDWLFEEGAEEEDLEDLRDRCMSSWAELATRTIEEKLRNAAKAVPGVLDARIDAQHPRGQGTVDVIVTGAAGEASPELIRKVGEAIEPLKGNYEDYLVKSSEVVRQDFELVIYLAEDAATDGVDAQATKLIEDMMALTRGEMNTLYRDSIIQVLSTKIDNYRKTDILQPSDDMVLEQDKVIMAGDINVTVRNVVQSARGKE